MLQIQRITENVVTVGAAIVITGHDYRAVTIAGINGGARGRPSGRNKFFRAISPAHPPPNAPLPGWLNAVERYRAAPARNQKSRPGGGSFRGTWVLVGGFNSLIRTATAPFDGGSGILEATRVIAQ